MGIPRFPVEGGHVLTFARAVGEFGAPYTDTEFGSGGLAEVAAPPTFLQASAQFDPEYALRPRPGAPARASAERASVLHAEQRFEFVRPVRVGDVLTATERPGRSWEKVSRRGGRLVFSESITEYYDTAGDLVATVVAVAVQTGTAAEQEGQTP
jgi:hypothetical protein